MSNDVVWQVLRPHNSFVVKRDGITLSREPGNLMNRHSYKFSGLANRKLVHVAAGKDKKPHLTILTSATSAHRNTQTQQCPLNTPLNRALTGCDVSLSFSAPPPLLPPPCVCSARTARDHMRRTVTPLLKHRRDRSIRAAHVINNATERSYHRADLTKFAIARYHALHRAGAVKEGTGVNVKRRRVGAKARKAAKPTTA